MLYSAFFRRSQVVFCQNIQQPGEHFGCYNCYTDKYMENIRKLNS